MSESGERRPQEGRESGCQCCSRFGALNRVDFDSSFCFWPAPRGRGVGFFFCAPIMPVLSYFRGIERPQFTEGCGWRYRETPSGFLSFAKVCLTRRWRCQLRSRGSGRAHEGIDFRRQPAGTAPDLYRRIEGPRFDEVIQRRAAHADSRHHVVNRDKPFTGIRDGARTCGGCGGISHGKRFLIVLPLFFTASE
jgi:hypothetical protein